MNHNGNKWENKQFCETFFDSGMPNSAKGLSFINRIEITCRWDPPTL